MKLFFSCVLFFLMASACFPQQQFTITKYTEEQGLPTGTIQRMFEDTTGFLWLWGEGSVARFDGYNFKVFQHNPDDTTSLPGSTQRDAKLMANGDLYFNFDGGSRLYDPRKLSFNSQFAYKDAGKLLNRSFMLKSDKSALCFFSADNLMLVNNSVCEYFPLPKSSFIRAESDSSNLILVNDSGKVFTFNANTKKLDQLTLYDRSGKVDTTVYDVIYSSKKKQFIAISKKHLYRFTKNPDRFIPDFDLHHSGVDGQLCRNNYFALTTHGELYKLNIETGEEKTIYLNKKIPEDEIKSKSIFGAMDKKGLFWIRSTSMGLFCYDTNTDQYEQFINEPGNPGSIPSNSVYFILPDDEGMAWILCRGKGLVKIEPVVHVMEHLSPPKNTKEMDFGDEFKNIRTFLETESSYWVGSLKGLFTYDAAKKELSELKGVFGSGSTPIGTLAKDGSGNSWVGGWKAPLRILNPKNSRYILYEIPFRKLRVRDLFCDSKNTMWIATEGDGIYTVNANEIDFENPASLKFNHISYEETNEPTNLYGIVFNLCEDRDGNIWAGTNKGLNRYDRYSKKWTRYLNIPGDEHSIHGNDIRSFAFDKKGNMWVGTNGGGLNRYNKAGNNFTHFTTENGLPDNEIYTILCDNNGMLWMGTNRGLCRFDPNNYSCQNFTLKDGIQNYEYNTEAALKLKDGTLLFGGVDGYNVIHPDKIQNTKSLPPPVVISSIKIFNHEVPPGDNHLRLKHSENSLSFEFSALSFYRNQDYRYAYQMEGIDPDWIHSNSRRFVSYSNLTPGDYVFKVKASNSAGVWSNKIASLLITISPPWWRTWAAYSLYVIVIVGSIWYFIKSREKSLKENQKKLEQTVLERTEEVVLQKDRAEQLLDDKEMLIKEIHHRVKNNLEVISSLLELQSEGIDDAKAKAAVLEGQSRVQSIALIHHKLYRTDDVSSVEFKSFANDLFKQVSGVFKKATTEIDFKIHADETQIPIDAAVPIGLILNELLTNTFKYAVSDAKTNTISIQLQPGMDGHQSKIIYADNGPGMPEHFDLSKSNSLGMKVIQLLTKQLGGTLNFYNDNGSVFEIPFNNNHKN